MQINIMHTLQTNPPETLNVVFFDIVDYLHSNHVIRKNKSYGYLFDNYRLLNFYCEIFDTS